MNNMIDADGNIVPDTRSAKERKVANRDYMRKWRLSVEAQERKKRLNKLGKCEICEMLLVSKYHTGCISTQIPTNN